MEKTIGEGDYRRQVQRLKDKRQPLTELLEEAQLSINEAAIKTAKDIFELAIKADSLGLVTGSIHIFSKSSLYSNWRLRYSRGPARSFLMLFATSSPHTLHDNQNIIGA